MKGDTCQAGRKVQERTGKWRSKLSKQTNKKEKIIITIKI
jgi:hypothetical protein